MQEVAGGRQVNLEEPLVKATVRLVEAMREYGRELNVETIIKAIFSGGMLGLFLLGFLFRRADGRAGLIGVIAGAVVILWMTLSSRWLWLPDWGRSPFHGFLVSVSGTATVLRVGVLSTALRRK